MSATPKKNISKTRAMLEMVMTMAVILTVKMTVMALVVVFFGRDAGDEWYLTHVKQLGSIDVPGFGGGGPYLTFVHI